MVSKATFVDVKFTRPRLIEYLFSKLKKHEAFPMMIPKVTLLKSWNLQPWPPVSSFPQPNLDFSCGKEEILAEVVD